MEEECYCWDDIKDVSVTDAALGNFPAPRKCNKDVEVIIREVG